MPLKCRSDKGCRFQSAVFRSFRLSFSGSLYFFMSFFKAPCTCATEVPGESFTNNCDAELVLPQTSKPKLFFRPVACAVANEINCLNVKSEFSVQSFTTPLTVV